MRKNFFIALYIFSANIAINIETKGRTIEKLIKNAYSFKIKLIIFAT